MNLMNKYRPTSFNEVVGQDMTVSILEKQITTGNISNCYLFYGPSGTGKTTLAYILSKRLNNGVGEPIEINAASNNGVDNVRSIIEEANLNPVVGAYKIFILDEAHMLTTQAWNAFLKTIEEPPKRTIFIFCTTEVNKVPETIRNRVMQFKLNNVQESDIRTRLSYICNSENINIAPNALDYLCKIAEGSVRLAVSYLDKVYSMTNNIDTDSVVSAIGRVKYDYLFNLVDSIVDGNESNIISIVNEQLKFDNDINLLLDTLISFVLELTKYLIFYGSNVCNIPAVYEDKIKYTVGICPNIGGSIKYYKQLLNVLLNIKSEIKDSSIGNVILTSRLISINIEKECGCESIQN